MAGSVTRLGRSIAVAGGLLLLGAFLGRLSLHHYLYAGAMAVCLLVLSAVGLKTPSVTGARPLARSFRWVPWAWLVLLLVSSHKFSAARTPGEAVLGNASSENIVELAAFAVIGMMVLARWTIVSSRWLDGAPFYGWAVVALISTAWSEIAFFTFLRSAQLFVPISLGILTARIWRQSPPLGRTLWVRTVRMFINATVALTVLGFVNRDWWIDTRFSWPGTHPGIAAVTGASALLLLLFAGRAVLGYSLVGFLARALPLSAGLFMSQTRAVVAGFIVAGIVAFWFAGGVRPLVRYIGLPTYLAVALLLVVFVGPQLRDYALRHQRVEYVAEFNGRAGLWEVALDDVSEGDKWPLGYGYGTPRVRLSRHVSWAGTAHNAVLELLIGTGLVGLGAGLLGLLLLARGLIRPRGGADAHIRVAAASVFACLIVASGASSSWTIPSVDLSMLALLLAFALAPARSTVEMVTTGRNRELVASRSGNGRGPARRAYPSLTHRATEGTPDELTTNSM